MKDLDSHRLHELKLLKYYRLIRRFMCKTYDLKDADLELLVYLHCKGHFRRKDFEDGCYTYTWDNNRWARLVAAGWIVPWRKRNHTDRLYTIYDVSYQAKFMIKRMYRIMLGEEDLPTTDRSKYYYDKSYTGKTTRKAIDLMNRDKDR